jgi:hypothetical protein
VRCVKAVWIIVGGVKVPSSAVTDVQGGKPCISAEYGSEHAVYGGYRNVAGVVLVPQVKYFR